MSEEKPPRRSPPQGAVPDFILEPDERATPLSIRVTHIEARQDQLDGRLAVVAKDVSDTKAVAGRLEGQLNGQDRVLANIQQSVSNLSAREHVAFTARVDVDRAKQITQIEDDADKKKNRRARVTKLVGFATGGGLLVELLHRLGIL